MELTAQWFLALGQVILIDLVLAGDNAIVVGLAAAGVAAEHRRKVIFWGIGAAVVLRILFAAVTTQLLAILGLTLAGGVLLLWVCWKFWRELRHQDRERKAAKEVEAAIEDGTAPAPASASSVQPKTVRSAIIAIAAADVSMSLDNVLAVAGAARDHMDVLILGLLLSVVLMGIAANAISRLLVKWHWLAYVGLAVIFYVALDMIYRGSAEVLRAI